jgi:hypothetical protein
MSSKWNVTALVELPLKIRQMQQVYQVCDIAGVPVPDSVINFFNHNKIDPYDKSAEIGEVSLFTLGRVDPVHESVSISVSNESCEDIYVIDLSKLPKGTEKLRITIV